MSKAPSTIVCREDEQRRVFDFVKSCMEEKKAGSLYICGCPGTGKSLSMEKVSQQAQHWAKQVIRICDLCESINRKTDIPFHDMLSGRFGLP